MLLLHSLTFTAQMKITLALCRARARWTDNLKTHVPSLWIFIKSLFDRSPNAGWHDACSPTWRTCRWKRSNSACAAQWTFHLHNAFIIYHLLAQQPLFISIYQTPFAHSSLYSAWHWAMEWKISCHLAHSFHFRKIVASWFKMHLRLF